MSLFGVTINFDNSICLRMPPRAFLELAELYFERLWSSLRFFLHLACFAWRFGGGLLWCTVRAFTNFIATNDGQALGDLLFEIRRGFDFLPTQQEYGDSAMDDDWQRDQVIKCCCRAIQRVHRQSSISAIQPDLTEVMTKVFFREKQYPPRSVAKWELGTTITAQLMVFCLPGSRSGSHYQK